MDNILNQLAPISYEKRERIRKRADLTIYKSGGICFHQDLLRKTGLGLRIQISAGIIDGLPVLSVCNDNEGYKMAASQNVYIINNKKIQEALAERLNLDPSKKWYFQLKTKIKEPNTQKVHILLSLKETR
jgi:hypothetical protein